MKQRSISKRYLVFLFLAVFTLAAFFPKNTEAAAKSSKKIVRLLVAPGESSSVNNVKSAIAKITRTSKVYDVRCTVASKNCDIRKYDGLILPGGGDIHPSRYGQKNQGSFNINTTYDAVQFAWLKKFVQAKKPVFGLCRGLQIINVYFGGTLYQDMKNHRGVWHTVTPKNYSVVQSSKKVTKKSLMYKAYNGKKVRTLSLHHQAVRKLGKNLKATMVSADGRIEAIEHTSLPIYATQWHPENMYIYYNDLNGRIILGHFVSICYHYRNK
ncbi:MAG: gamma-glutamyl-gamma-aminobutyrate hydrolase family protein [Eubacteriales bacterium]|nr:gamma-glutamyl-gamma-aminobutyrate hydrolase family protein [Eubacteriales bacterium]